MHGDSCGPGSERIQDDNAYMQWWTSASQATLLSLFAGCSAPTIVEDHVSRFGGLVSGLVVGGQIG